jgi:hypothetical protein
VNISLLTLREFMRAGVPLTVVNAGVYWFFLRFL